MKSNFEIPNSNQIIMKNYYALILACVCFSFARATNEVPNSSFASWSAGNPAGWSTDNGGVYYTTVSDAGVGYTDAHAAKGQPATYLSDTIPPLLTTPGSGGYGFNISANYNNLSFYYKAILVNGDRFIVTVALFDAGHAGTAVGVATITNNASSFTLENVAISQYSSNTPVTAVISFVLSGPLGSSEQPSPSSFFIVDDVSLNIVAGINEVLLDRSLEAYPVPAHNAINIKGERKSGGTMQLMLVDVAGRIVKEYTLVSEGNLLDEQLSLENVDAGVYSLAVITNNKLINRKIIVQ